MRLRPSNGVFARLGSNELRTRRYTPAPAGFSGRCTREGTQQFFFDFPYAPDLPRDLRTIRYFRTAPWVDELMMLALNSFGVR